jgi:hypothetical protein
MLSPIRYILLADWIAERRTNKYYIGKISLMVVINKPVVGTPALRVCQWIVKSNEQIPTVRLYVANPAKDFGRVYPTKEERIRHVLETPGEEERKYTVFTRDQFLSLESLPSIPQGVWVISSRTTAGRHIPMMDLDAHTTGYDRDTINRIIDQKCKGMTGYVLTTARGFHYYGGRLLNEWEWHRFLASFGVLHYGATGRYISYGLLYGETGLRLTSDKAKPGIPSLLRTIEKED